MAATVKQTPGENTLHGKKVKTAKKNETADASTQAIFASKIDFKLNLADPKHPVLADAGRAWLKGITGQLDQNGIDSKRLRVAVCVRNLTGFVAQRAESHGTFSLFNKFTKWFRTELNITDKPSTIEFELRNTVQQGAYKAYGLKFLELAAKNEACEFRKSEDELKVVFLTNMKNNKLRENLTTQRCSFRELVQWGFELIDKGLVGDYDDIVRKRSDSWGGNDTKRHTNNNRRDGRFNTGNQGSYRQDGHGQNPQQGGSRDFSATGNQSGDNRNGNNGRGGRSRGGRYNRNFQRGGFSQNLVNRIEVPPRDEREGGTCSDEYEPLKD